MTTNKKILTIFIIIILFNSRESKGNDYRWELISSDEGCFLYKSSVQDHKFNAYKCKAILKSRMETICCILRDIPNYNKWMYKIIESQVLKTLDETKNAFIFYILQSVPIYSDRDVVLISESGNMVKDNKTHIRFWSTEEFDHPHKDGVVRMDKMIGQWTLEWIDREHTAVTYMVDIDIAGNVIAWLGNSELKNVPLNTIKGLEKISRSKKYIQIAEKSKYRKNIEMAIRNGLLK